MRRIIVTVLAVLAVAGGVCGPGRAATTTVTVGLVGKTSNDWPLYVAAATGIFAANGLSVDVIDAGSPVGATQDLVTGAIDVGAVTSTQCVQAIQNNVPIVSLIELTDKPPYLILGRKGLTSIEQLRGKTVIVSSPNAITRVFTDTIMNAHGLKDSDFTYTYAGSTNERYAALLSGGVDAAMLLPPFSFHAIAQGYPVLDSVLKHYARFPFDTYAAGATWASQHRAVTVAFLKSILQATRWLYLPANREKAIAILVDQTGTAPGDATETYDELVAKTHDYSRGGESSASDYELVLDALAQLGQVKPPLPAPTKFFDNSYLDAARAQLGMR